MKLLRRRDRRGPANLVERDFHADAPNMLWVTDVTQFTMDGYKCWLSPVVDCFDKVQETKIGRAHV